MERREPNDHGGGADARPEHRLGAEALAFAPLLVAVGVHLVGAVQRRWVQEDGFITIRVAQQVLAGNGPVYNAGERVEAFTSPLWLGILVVLRTVTFGQVSYEWLTVLAGIALAVAGTVGLLTGSVALWTPLGRRAASAWWVPAGALTVVALPAVWDFSSAGLETGLGMAWIGWSFAVVVRTLRGAARRDRSRAAPAGRRSATVDDTATATATVDGLTAPTTEAAVGGTSSSVGEVDRVRILPALVLVSLGPLVRPELALYSVAFAAVLVGLAWFPVRRHLHVGPRWWAVVAAFVGVPLAYQFFRMGYYAALVPNTALAKDAELAQWERGVDYLANTVGPYRLLLPALPLGAGLLLALSWLPRRDQRAVVVALVVPALLHGLYVVRLGGDYMHGRFWILPLVALVAPVAAVPVPRGWARSPAWAQSAVRLVGVGVVAVWAVGAIGWFRPPRQSGSLVDQRAAIVDVARSPHPIRLGEQPAPFPALGGALAERAGTNQYLDTDEVRLLIWAGDLSEATISAKGSDVLGQVATATARDGGGLIIRYDGLGMVGVAAGTEVSIIDNFGLADPVASRLPTLSDFAAGHTHQLPVAWRRARARVAGPDAPGSEAAARALACGALGRYLADITEPMTPGRFLTNLVSAPANTWLDVPADPAEAEARFCR